MLITFSKVNNNQIEFLYFSIAVFLIGVPFRFFIEKKINKLGGFLNLNERQKYIYRQWRQVSGLFIFSGIITFLLYIF